jgi:hypothetical protein
VTSWGIRHESRCKIHGSTASSHCWLAGFPDITQ